MALHDDLLWQATHLLTLDKGRPKQANLRRAVSALYYALFHLLVLEGSRAISPPSPVHIAFSLRRVFDHATMLKACEDALNPRSRLSSVFGSTGVSNDLRVVAEAFRALQDARHKADYDPSYRLNRKAVELKVEEAEEAFAAWRRLRGSDEANVFLVALLFRNWPRA